MRIVYLNPLGTIGGAERVLLDLIASIRQADPSAELHLVVATDGPLIEQANQAGVGVTLLPMPEEMVEVGDSGLKGQSRVRDLLAMARRGPATGLATWRYVHRLQQSVTALQPDILHSNGIKFHLLTRFVRLQKVPVLWHLHDFLSSRALMARALRWASARAAGAIAVSQAVAQDARSVLRQVPIEVIPNAVDTDYFSPRPGDGRRLDELAGLSPAAPATVRVGLLATFARWKGQDVFLEAIARMSDLPQFPVRFYIIGGSIYRTRGSQFTEDELRAQAAGRGVAGRVGFIGFQHRPADIYRSLDIVVHASTQPEAFGLTIVEAMACARPVIVARTGGTSELFTHNHDAVGIPPGDPAALALAIKQLVDDPERRRRIGQNARCTAVHRFNRVRLGPQVLEIYRQLIRQNSFATYQQPLIPDP